MLVRLVRDNRFTKLMSVQTSLFTEEGELLSLTEVVAILSEHPETRFLEVSRYLFVRLRTHASIRTNRGYVSSVFSAGIPVIIDKFPANSIAYCLP